LYTNPEKLLKAQDWQSATWEELEEQQRKNENAKSRSVGLVIETRPDYISKAEVIRVRRLGCTKTQIGVQSLQDEVLQKNKRGHGVAATERAFKLLRQAGFKIHAHWMANLHGSSVELDKQDYLKLFNDEHFKPDELKIYPCSLISSAELMEYYKRGEWQPYTHDELLEVLQFALLNTPKYCRLTRVIRDIPSTDIVVGNKKTNFREIATQELEKAGEKSQDIRSREVRGSKFKEEDIELRVTEYETTVATEKFIEFVVQSEVWDNRNGQDGSGQKKTEEKLLGFLRLSLPKEESFIEELKASAIIREIHVYGQVVGIDKEGKDRAQHLGLGTKLIAQAKELSKEAGFKKLNVISAIGTKEYYRKKGFSDGQLYQYMEL
jgi:elongator complex protein 3